MSVFCQLFSLLNIAYLNQTRIRSFNNFRNNRTQWPAVKQTYCSYEQSGSRKTIRLLHKNMKLVVNSYATP